MEDKKEVDYLELVRKFRSLKLLFNTKEGLDNKIGRKISEGNSLDLNEKQASIAYSALNQFVRDEINREFELIEVLDMYELAKTFYDDKIKDYKKHLDKKLRKEEIKNILEFILKIYCNDSYDSEEDSIFNKLKMSDQTKIKKILREIKNKNAIFISIFLWLTLSKTKEKDDDEKDNDELFRDCEIVFTFLKCFIEKNNIQGPFSTDAPLRFIEVSDSRLSLINNVIKYSNYCVFLSIQRTTFLL